MRCQLRLKSLLCLCQFALSLKVLMCKVQRAMPTSRVFLRTRGKHGRCVTSSISILSCERRSARSHTPTVVPNPYEFLCSVSLQFFVVYIQLPSVFAYVFIVNYGCKYLLPGKQGRGQIFLFLQEKGALCFRRTQWSILCFCTLSI